MYKLLTLLLLLLSATCTRAQRQSAHTNYEKLDTAQIRKILSEPVNFSEEHTDSLASHFQHLYSRSNTLHFWWGRMKASSLLGFAYEMNGSSELALMCFQRAISIANETKEFNPFIPDLYLTIANLYLSREDYQKALELIDKCEQYLNFYRSNYTTAEFSNQHLIVNCRRSQAYTGLNRIPESVKSLDAAVGAVSNIEKLKPDQMMKLNMARYYVNDKLQRYKTCKNLLFANIAYSRTLEGHDRGRFNYAPLLAILYIKMGDYKKAYSYADSAKNARLYHTYIQWQLHLHKKMVKADSATGNTQALIDRYKKIQSLKDTLERRNQLSSTAYYQTELDIQTHINSLKQKEVELKSKSLIIAMAFALVLFLTVIVFLIWRNFSKTRQNVRELSLLNDQIKSKHTDMMIAYNSLEKSHEDNKQLMKVVAHDLRNPLASSMLFLENIQNQLTLNTETSTALNTVKISTSNSLSLIDDLLHNNPELEEVCLEMVELHALLQYCVNLLTAKAEEKSLTLKLQTEPVSIMTDREKIWRVMSNLIHNAIKFSTPESTIEVEVKRKDDKVLISIKDHGIGIPESYKRDIFEMFSPAQRPGTQGEESFGMGLAISKSIVESFEGKIWFESQEGMGTTFFVEFPVSNSNQ